MMKMNKSKYQIGDRFTVMDTVECEIVRVFGKKETAYVFQLFGNPIFKSIITEKDLDKVIASQSA